MIDLLLDLVLNLFDFDVILDGFDDLFNKVNQWINQQINKDCSILDWFDGLIEVNWFHSFIHSSLNLDTSFKIVLLILMSFCCSLTFLFRSFLLSFIDGWKEGLGLGWMKESKKTINEWTRILAMISILIFSFDSHSRDWLMDWWMNWRFLMSFRSLIDHRLIDWLMERKEEWKWKRKERKGLLKMLMIKMKGLFVHFLDVSFMNLCWLMIVNRKKSNSNEREEERNRRKGKRWLNKEDYGLLIVLLFDFHFIHSFWCILVSFILSLIHSLEWIDERDWWWNARKMKERKRKRNKWQ